MEHNSPNYKKFLVVTWTKSDLGNGQSPTNLQQKFQIRPELFKGIMTSAYHSAKE